jgi:hypothetical protein
VQGGLLDATDVRIEDCGVEGKARVLSVRGRPSVRAMRSAVRFMRLARSLRAMIDCAGMPKRMTPKILSVVYMAQVHSTQRRFSIPKDVMRALKVRTKGRIALSVRKASSGELVFFGDHITVKSAREVYGPDVSALDCSGIILVEASNPRAD